MPSSRKLAGHGPTDRVEPVADARSQATGVEPEVVGVRLAPDRDQQLVRSQRAVVGRRRQRELRAVAVAVAGRCR
jgi:hypothetical protein